MPVQVSIAALALAAVLLVMAGEAVLSAFNARVLRARGAISPSGADRIHGLTVWAYPASFVIMACEGAWWGPSPPAVLGAGLAVFGLSKALKMWAMSALGVRWTFPVLILPDTPPVTHGPYAVLRHPNYLAVIGEMAALALIVWAPVSGSLALVGYGALLWRKMAVEDRALGRQ